jgi:oligopeptide/dipeptide ABC transporter ATP-binding protein
LALVGESGSGKTTLARAVLRLLEPTEGSILFKGRDVLSMSPGELLDFRRLVQIVFQDPFGSLNPRLRAGRMLEEVLQVHSSERKGEGRKGRARELLELVGLPPATVSRFPHEFSGGQRQRLGIARALAVEPEVLVLDEPVSSLDLSVQAQILNLLGELQGALNLTYLFVSHDLSVVRHMADRVAVLYLGRVVEEGPVSTFFSRPLHPYSIQLLAAAELLGVGVEEGRAEGGGDPVERGMPTIVSPPTGCAYHPRCHHPLKDGVCRREDPPLQGLDGGGKVACWKVGKHPVNP